MTTEQQFTTTPASQDSTDQIATGLSGFSDPIDFEADPNTTAATTLFISAPSGFSKGRCAYFLNDDDERVYVPRQVKAWLLDVSITTQESEQWGPSEKLLVRIQTADGSVWILRMSLSTWTASSILMNFRRMSRAELSEQIQITLQPKSRTVFIGVGVLQPDGETFRSVELDPDELGQKLSLDQMMDAITWANGGGNGSALEQLQQQEQNEPEPEPIAQTAEPEGFTEERSDHAPVNQSAFVRNFKAARRKQLSRAGRANTKVAG